MGNREGDTKSLHTRTASESQQPLCTNGMVTSPHYLATEAGLAILRKGGNALDAAIACATTLTVVYSHLTNIRGTGILLQNRGSFFSLDPNHVNHLEPGKRTFHTLNPAMLMKDERPCLVYGTMGGEGQPQTQAQIVTRIMDYGMTPNDAIRAPRFLYGRAWGKERSSVQLEDRIPQNVQDDLKRLGHPVEYVESFCDAMGHAGAVLCHENGVLQGGSDPRSDGLASGY